jgi:glycosyltransferase involved in cell wall biosynthesis
VLKPLRVGYILKRFPRASETFIANEILELERQGVEVEILALRASEDSFQHGWIQAVRAQVRRYEEISFSTAWKLLQKRADRWPERRGGIHQALVAAFDHPVRSGRRYLAEAVFVAGLAEKLGLQYLHAHFANHPAFVAMLAHLICGVPYSFTAHAKDIFAAGPTPDLWRQQVRRAAFSVTVSEANRIYLASILGSRLAAKLRRLYNGVDLRSVVTSPHSHSGTPLRVLFVGRLVEKKGADVLIETAAALRLRKEPVVFTLVGDGPEGDSLRVRARELGLSDTVRFTSRLAHEQVMLLMRESDLLVLPCRVAADGDRDALPTVLLEAMASGLPCISTPVNGVTEIVEDGRTGLLVPENCPQDLAEAILSLSSDPSRRRRMGQEGRKKAERQFNLRDNAAVLRRWMEEAAETPTINNVEPMRGGSARMR